MTEIEIVELKEKGRLIQSALNIINVLASNPIADTDIEFDDMVANDIQNLQRLIIKARVLTDSRWWGDMI
jgi:hypothetical protein